MEQNPPDFGADLIFFSFLDERKEAKEDQGLTEAGEEGRVHVGKKNSLDFQSFKKADRVGGRDMFSAKKRKGFRDLGRTLTMIRRQK